MIYIKVSTLIAPLRTIIASMCYLIRTTSTTLHPTAAELHETLVWYTPTWQLNGIKDQQLFPFFLLSGSFNLCFFSGWINCIDLFADPCTTTCDCFTCTFCSTKKDSIASLSISRLLTVCFSNRRMFLDWMCPVNSFSNRANTCWVTENCKSVSFFIKQ